MSASIVTSRARYYSSADGFNIARPPVPPHVFTAERDAALDAAAPTGLVALDLGPTLQTGFAATTPLILARYARVRAGEKLSTRFAASGEIYYVLQGRGQTQAGTDVIAWAVGDVFCLPGGGAATHLADDETVLWVVTDEPALAFARVAPPAPGAAPIEAVHFPAADIARHLDAIYRRPDADTLVGKALSFGSARLEAAHTILPGFTLAMNSLDPGESQRPHRHNAVAVTLVVRGERCYSMLDGVRVPWQRHAVMITPPGTVHSHHNDGDERALFLIVQDGGHHYHCRTMGFSY